MNYGASTEENMMENLSVLFWEHTVLLQEPLLLMTWVDLNSNMD